LYVPVDDGALLEVCVGDNFPNERLNECLQLGAALGAPLSRITWRNGVAIRTPV
jgi:hypothetical protein